MCTHVDVENIPTQQNTTVRADSTSSPHASLCTLSCCRATWVGAHSPRLALLKAMATRGSNGLQKTISSSSPFRTDNAMLKMERITGVRSSSAWYHEGAKNSSKLADLPAKLESN